MTNAQKMYNIKCITCSGAILLYVPSFLFCLFGMFCVHTMFLLWDLHCVNCPVLFIHHNVKASEMLISLIL